jgi:hypothetical protein
LKGNDARCSQLHVTRPVDSLLPTKPFELSGWRGGRFACVGRQKLPLARLDFEWFRSYDRLMEFLGFGLASMQNMSLALSGKMALKSP